MNMLPTLIVIAGPARGQVIPLSSVVTLGRDASSAHVIGDGAMSRRHCSIELRDSQYVVTDLDSRNGTLVNGLPVRSHALGDGDELRVGDSVLLFVGVARNTVPTPHNDPTVTAPLVVEPHVAPSATFTSEQSIRHDLVGQSPAMLDTLRRVSRAAPTTSTVLISGESGTGKELIARAIHANSARAGAPFVAINCAAIPDGLMESELFGHERGAFTGAVAQHCGRIEAANGGTVFLDEITELSPPLQAKLLRVLQERQIDRVGGRRPIPVDIRVIAATNRDLAAAVKAEAFRGDLYFRINVVSIDVPPLRERAGDVLLLMSYFLRKHAAQCKRRIRGVTREARSILTRHDWPGNVRELENAIEQAVVMSSGEWIDTGDLPQHLLEVASVNSDDGYHAKVNAAKRDAIRRALELAGGNVAEAARQLQLQPTYLHRLIKNLGVRAEKP